MTPTTNGKPHPTPRCQSGREYKTTPKWGIKPPPTAFLAIFHPWGGFMPLGGDFVPSWGGGVIPSKGWFYPCKGVGFSPPRGWFYPPIGSFWGGGVYPPFSVILSVNLQPQYRKTSCFRSTCCAKGAHVWGWGRGVHFGYRGRRGDGGSRNDIWFYTQCFASHCSLYMCYGMCDVVGDNFTSRVRNGTSYMVWVCYSSSSTCIAFVVALFRLLLFVVLCCFGGKKPP